MSSELFGPTDAALWFASVALQRGLPTLERVRGEVVEQPGGYREAHWRLTARTLAHGERWAESYGMAELSNPQVGRVEWTTTGPPAEPGGVDSAVYWLAAPAGAPHGLAPYVVGTLPPVVPGQGRSWTRGCGSLAGTTCRSRSTSSRTAASSASPERRQ